MRAEVGQVTDLPSQTQAGGLRHLPAIESS